MLKKLLLVSSVVALCAFQARTSQLAFMALQFEGAASSNLPSGWQPKITHGKPDISVVRDQDGSFLRLRSNRASFGLERGMDIDTDAMPWLTWRWKAVQIPAGGDFRRSRTDDQAAQVLVAFSDRRIVTYLWDSSAPKDTMQNASSIPLVHIFAIVCRSGGSELNQWLNEARNVADDYQRAYGRRAPRVKGLRLQINSQHTGTIAESWFGQVAFRNTPQ